MKYLILIILIFFIACTQPKESCLSDYILNPAKNDSLCINEINGKFYVGWIPYDMQCANPYTTCT